MWLFRGRLRSAGSIGDPRRVVDMTAWRTRDEAEEAVFA
jgi:hypothetical protein